MSRQSPHEKGRRSRRLRVQLGPWELPGVEKILARSSQPLRASLGQPHGALSESSRARGTLGGHQLCDWGDL